MEDRHAQDGFTIYGAACGGVASCDRMIRPGLFRSPFISSSSSACSAGVIGTGCALRGKSCRTRRMPCYDPFYRDRSRNARDVDGQTPSNFPNAHRRYLVSHKRGCGKASPLHPPTVAPLLLQGNLTTSISGRSTGRPSPGEGQWPMVCRWHVTGVSAFQHKGYGPAQRIRQ
jgi:hypothetical protein